MKKLLLLFVLLLSAGTPTINASQEQNKKKKDKQKNDKQKNDKQKNDKQKFETKSFEAKSKKELRQEKKQKKNESNKAEEKTPSNFCMPPEENLVIETNTTTNDISESSNQSKKLPIQSNDFAGIFFMNSKTEEEEKEKEKENVSPIIEKKASSIIFTSEDILKEIGENENKAVPEEVIKEVAPVDNNNENSTKDTIEKIPVDNTIEFTAPKNITENTEHIEEVFTLSKEQDSKKINDLTEDNDVQIVEIQKSSDDLSIEFEVLEDNTNVTSSNDVQKQDNHKDLTENPLTDTSSKDNNTLLEKENTKVIIEENLLDSKTETKENKNPQDYQHKKRKSEDEEPQELNESKKYKSSTVNQEVIENNNDDKDDMVEHSNDKDDIKENMHKEKKASLLDLDDNFGGTDEDFNTYLYGTRKVWSANKSNVAHQVEIDIDEKKDFDDISSQEDENEDFEVISSQEKLENEAKHELFKQTWSLFINDDSFNEYFDNDQKVIHSILLNLVKSADYKKLPSSMDLYNDTLQMFFEIKKCALNTDDTKEIDSGEDTASEDEVIVTSKAVPSKDASVPAPKASRWYSSYTRYAPHATIFVATATIASATYYYREPIKNRLITFKNTILNWLYQ